jgi:L-asparaginase
VNRKKIVVLGTGGTIAGTGAGGNGSPVYTAAQRGVDELLLAIPGLAQFALQLVSEQVLQIDSKDMDFTDWQRLLQRCAYWLERDDVQGLVLTHGTDTLEETAYFLQSVLAPSKPVVLTCAMRPATALGADGPQNLMDALSVASHPGAHGVVAVCAATIHSALDVQKVHTWRLDAFSSGDAGALGHVRQGQPMLHRDWPRSPVLFSRDDIDKLVHRPSWPRVEIVLSHAGATGAAVDALVSPQATQLLGTEPVRGLVVAATGNGSMHYKLEAALLRAQSAGVKVVRATRCCNAQLIPVTDQAIEDSNGLPPAKARVAVILALCLQSGNSIG